MEKELASLKALNEYRVNASTSFSTIYSMKGFNEKGINEIKGIRANWLTLVGKLDEFVPYDLAKVETLTGEDRRPVEGKIAMDNYESIIIMCTKLKQRVEYFLLNIDQFVDKKLFSILCGGFVGGTIGCLTSHFKLLPILVGAAVGTSVVWKYSLVSDLEPIKKWLLHLQRSLDSLIGKTQEVQKGFENKKICFLLIIHNIMKVIIITDRNIKRDDLNESKTLSFLHHFGFLSLSNISLLSLQEERFR
jgi:hypothetical protein